MQPHTPTMRVIVSLAALGLVASGLVAEPAAASTPGGHRAGRPASGVIFDDFHYRSSADAKLAAHGWTVRSGSGGPGVEAGATWRPSDVTFPTVDGHRVLQLAMTTNGTAPGTTESEFTRTAANSLAGTYLARIKFADAPARGRDGDHLVESFFAISTTPDCDPTYSETDFSEYLPNGGYGGTKSVNSQTTWYSTGENCSDSVETDETVSLRGWHTVLATVANGHVRYFIDGKLVADHSGKYYPRRDMQIDFNLWLIDLTGHRGSATSTWHEDVDYVYYAKNQVLTPAQAQCRVDGLRRRHVSYLDTV